MNIDRQMVARAVLEGQIGVEHMTSEELLEINLNLMEAITDRMIEQGRIVFAEHDTVQ